MAYELIDDEPKSRYEILPPDAPAVVKTGSMLNEIPRQAGLFTRYGIESLGNNAQIFTEPLRYFQDMVTPDRTPTLSGLVTGEGAPPKSMPMGVMATRFADWMGLPSPGNPTERVVADATRLGLGFSWVY